SPQCFHSGTNRPQLPASPPLRRHRTGAGSHPDPGTRQSGSKGRARVFGTGLERRYPASASVHRGAEKTRPDTLQTVANYWLFCALAERNADAAKEALAVSGQNPIILANENIVFDQPFIE